MAARISSGGIVLMGAAGLELFGIVFDLLDIVFEGLDWTGVFLLSFDLLVSCGDLYTFL
jgi:hypothetical protein